MIFNISMFEATGNKMKKVTLGRTNLLSTFIICKVPLVSVTPILRVGTMKHIFTKINKIDEVKH